MTEIAVKRISKYFRGQTKAFISYQGRKYSLPTDLTARYGLAAREGRINARILPGRNQLIFSERETGGEECYIGRMALDAQAKSRSALVRVADHIEEFRLKDVPISLHGGKARVEYRGVIFTFSREREMLYHQDLMAGKIFLRTGYRDRVAVVKKSGDEETILGSIRIIGRKLILPNRNIALDAGARSAYLPIDEAIEELGGREIKVRPRRNALFASFKAFRITFLLPLKKGGYYRDKIAAGLTCRIYPRRIEIGYREQGEFREIGRVNFDQDGRLQDPDNTLRRKIRQSKRGDQWVVLEKLIPELGRIEKRIAPATRLMVRSNVFRLSLDPGQPFYHDLQRGRLVLRSVGQHNEIFADRQTEKEYIATVFLPGHQRRAVNLRTWFSPSEWGEADVQAMIAPLIRSDYRTLPQLLTDGNGLIRLKRYALFGRDYLPRADAEAGVAAKLLFLYASGLELLGKTLRISPDLQGSFSQELFRTMALALNNPDLNGAREAMRTICQDAYSAYGQARKGEGEG
ncbi:MAG: hypothetical protein MUC35_03310 [Candidatus Margulisbacteria bacterium]|jgi:hypothetical protein|nr:hypothetical protein [Candidatus Margulisiibacteriota bacterium]